MTNREKEARISWPWFIVLLGAAAPMNLYANNLGEVTLVSLWLPLFLSLLAGLAIFGLSYLIFKNILKAGLITGIIEVFIFSYGHLYNLLKTVTVFGVQIGRHRYLFPLLLLVLGFLVWLVVKSKGSLENFTLLINIVALALFAVQLVRISSFEIKTYYQQRRDDARAGQTTEVEFAGPRPDIYIVLLDGYMRSDWLEESIGYDNSVFIRELEDLGFYIPTCSRSNYSYTILSMTSELNMTYLDELFDPLKDIETSSLLKHSEVRQILEGLGYDTVFFKNYYPWVDIDDGDYYFKPEDVSNYDPFGMLFLKTTVLKVPYDLFEKQIAKTKWSPEHEEITRTANLSQTIFNHLQYPHNYEEPVFVYAHILSPHTPYVFNADGSINYEWEADRLESQRQTYQYLDSQTILTVKAILDNTDPDPIIILQSDHGMGEAQYKNLTLNAFYLPEGGEQMLYPTITPVNFFRIIFDYYFDMDFDLLADKSYHSEKDSRYVIEEVQEPYDYCQDYAK
jgi:hypothetical protein